MAAGRYLLRDNPARSPLSLPVLPDDETLLCNFNQVTTLDHAR